jgi:GNAT superfamily N-acetyltransferase
VPSAPRRSGLPELERVRRAQADALVVQGELRTACGGEVAMPRDLVVMAAGFEAKGVNSGDVVGPDPDLDAARAFFARHGVEWGLRVPEEMPWEHGRLLFGRRLMALPRADFRVARDVARLELRKAGPEELPDVLRIDSTVFSLDLAENRQWLEPLLAAEERIDFALATLDGEPVGSAYTMRTDGAAGPCLYVAGVAVLAEARRRGVGAAMSSWLLARGFAGGAELAHLNPDTDAAARLYGRLGFAELPGHDIYTDL